MIPLSEIISKKAVLPEIKGKTKKEVLKELSKLLCNAYETLEHDTIYKLLKAREDISSTAIDMGIAIPHAKTSLTEKVCGAFARSTEGIEFGNDSEKSHLFFVIISPETNAGSHLMALAQISRLLQDDKLKEQLLTVETQKELYNLLTS